MPETLRVVLESDIYISGQVFGGEAAGVLLSAVQGVGPWPGGLAIRRSQRVPLPACPPQQRDNVPSPV